MTLTFDSLARFSRAPTNSALVELGLRVQDVVATGFPALSPHANVRGVGRARRTILHLVAPHHVRARHLVDACQLALVPRLDLAVFRLPVGGARVTSRGFPVMSGTLLGSKVGVVLAVFVIAAKHPRPFADVELSSVSGSRAVAVAR